MNPKSAPYVERYQDMLDYISKIIQIYQAVVKRNEGVAYHHIDPVNPIPAHPLNEMGSATMSNPSWYMGHISET